MKQDFRYEGVEVFQKNGTKTVRKVSVKNGKGFKSVSKYHNGKLVGTIKKKIHGGHTRSIHKRKFIPGLFADCCVKNKTCNKTCKNHSKHE